MFPIEMVEGMEFALAALHLDELSDDDTLVESDLVPVGGRAGAMKEVDAIPVAHVSPNGAAVRISVSLT